MREHLLAAWDMSGEKPIELNAPPLPENLAYLWEYFIQLHDRRQHNGFSEMPLSYLEIEAWSRLTKSKLDHWELGAILQLDNIYLKSIVDNKANNDG